MFGLSLIRNALATLASNILSLAQTVKDIEVNLRQRATLDGPEPADPAALPIPASVRPAGASDGSEVDSPDPAPTNATRNGRGKRAAASAQ